MESDHQSGFNLGDWRVSPREGRITRGEELVRLEPKVMEVLVYLASRAGEVVTREELERDVWHGALVGYDAVTGTVIKLRKALQDDARKPRLIATIPKRGYQLVAPISVPDDGRVAGAPQSPSSPTRGSRHVRIMRLSALAVVLLSLGSAVL